MRQDPRRRAECICTQSAATCRELLEREEHLWTFLRVEGVDSMNNAAERARHYAVIQRRLSGVTESASGSRFMERMLPVVVTCRQRGRNVLDYLIACHEARLLEHPIPSLLPEETAGIIAA